MNLGTMRFNASIFEESSNHLTRACDEEHWISFSLKWRLTDRSIISNNNKFTKNKFALQHQQHLQNQQQIHPALVNWEFQKLTKINPLFNNVNIGNEWEDLIEQSDLWVMETFDKQKC